MSKKSIVTISSCYHFQSIHYPNTVFPPAGHPLHPQLPLSKSSEPYRRHPNRASSQRHYATAQSHSTPQAPGDLPWPELSTPSTVPTPYQIFQLGEKAPYSKRRFYELVKLYHPDRHGHCCNVPHVDSLPSDSKMQRYRLVVAANDILSDPSRRRAYDHSGAGWSNHPDVGRSSSTSEPSMRQRWSGFHDDDSPAWNATWEDWEKWYERNSKQAQAPVYTSNGGFVSLVALVVALSALGQASRVDEHQQYLADRIELIHNDCHQSIQRRKDETRELSHAELAILRFMRSREQGGSPAGAEVPYPDDFEQEGTLPPEE
ncbi:MAG: hypothetical protein LQ346_000313 [Caloplaca aetnensis]|nr:MAG: hypothetical protein LQ346_000313 [Caloplaca aetnensis]